MSNERVGRMSCAPLGAILLMTTLSSCAPRSNSWTEEVELSGGETIQVSRHEEYRSNTELSGQTNVWIERSDVSIRDSRTGTTPPTLKTTEFLLRLDFDSEKRQWYAIGFVEDCDRARREGLGSRPYYEYNVINGTWSRQPVSEQRVGEASNLLISKKLAEESSEVRLDAKKRGDKGVGLPNYLKSVLDKVPC